ncbi:uncharacterized protein [Miscanthus floridulus]|uniref:uncharacterized protein n=1 Tax=Miscanthus floridulus TaxID=154761 RepID=UPI0034593991
MKQTLQPGLLQHKKLDELNNMDPFDFQEEGCKCTVTITHIPQDNNWWYIGCEKCKKKTTDDSTPFICSKCGWKRLRTRYKLSFAAADDTAKANFFCNDEMARMIVRRNCQTLLNSLRKNTDFPPEL